MPDIRMRTNRLRNGMIIKNNVYASSGAILIPHDTPVTKDIITLLSKHFIDYVIVDYQTKSNLPAPELHPEPPKISPQQIEDFKESFQISEEILSDSFTEIASTDRDIDVHVLLDALSQIVERAQTDVNLCDLLFLMKKNVKGLYAHSINTALFAQLLAKWLDYDRHDIEHITVAALLHDIGMLKFKEEDLEDFHYKDELKREPYSKHAIFGYNMIKEKSLDIRIKQAVLTHHERLDESGFPLKIAQNQISQFSRLIAIADVYDILTMKEEGTETLSPFDALKEFESNGHHKFDSHMLITFTSKIANTFVQHIVRLNNGEEGRIILINKYNLSRPLVQIGSSFIDLAMRNDLYIKEMLD